MTVPPRFAIGHFESDADRFLGVILNDRVRRVSDLDPAAGKEPDLLGLLDDWPASFDRLQRAVAAEPQGPVFELATLTPLAPLPNPRQLFCCGANYAKHVIQMMLATNVHPGLYGLDEPGRLAFARAFVAQQARESDPYIFMKTISSITGPEAVVELPPFSDRIDWEVELAVVFGRAAHRETRATAMSAVAGYMVVNDVTARDKVRRTDPGAIGADWVAAKGAPGFLPSGPWFVPSAFVTDPHALEMKLRVNGKVRQHARTGEMTFDIPRQIEFLSGFVRLLPGDILCTGTPEGNAIADGSFLRDGDVIEAEIEGLGCQRTRFRKLPG